MVLKDQSLYDLTLSDFSKLIENCVPEGPKLDYKAEAYSGRPSDIREMLRDIISFANHGGGYIILGIREDGYGHPHELNPIDNYQRKCQAIRQACLDGIQERIDGLEIVGYEVENNKGIVVIHIPPSNKAPHMVSMDHHSDFYKRYDTDKRVMTLDEIRSLMLNNPINSRFLELELLASGKLIKPAKGFTKPGPPYARIFTENAVDQFLQKYYSCNCSPKTLVIISPFISDLSGELIDLKDIITKINDEKTITYVVTRPSEEEYQKKSMELFFQSPYTEVRYNEYVHAKLFICFCRDDEKNSFAMFGSGNLTKGGVRHNLELGMMIYSRDYGRKLIRELYEWSSVGLRSQSKRIKQVNYNVDLRRTR